jgi:hypothetical protein
MQLIRGVKENDSMHVASLILGALPLLFIAAALTACSPASSEWQPLTVHEGGFTILMRGQPQYQRQALDTPAGKMEAHLYSSDRPDAYYAVGYSDYPLALVVGSAPEDLFVGVRDTWVRRLEGRLTAVDHRISKGAYRGYAFSAEGKAKGADALLDARLYLVDQRLYQIVSIGRRHEVPQGIVNRYLDSFELIEAAQVGSIRIEPAKK